MISMLLDLYSAFDTLDHSIISVRLNEIDIHGQIQSFI